MKKNRELKRHGMFSVRCKRLLTISIYVLIGIVFTSFDTFGQQNGKLISLKLNKVTLLEAIKEINRLGDNSSVINERKLKKKPNKFL